MFGEGEADRAVAGREGANDGGAGSAVALQFMRLGYYILDQPVLPGNGAGEVVGDGESDGMQRETGGPAQVERVAQAGAEGRQAIFNHIVALKAARDRA